MRYIDSIFTLRYAFDELGWRGTVQFIDIIYEQGFDRFPMIEIDRMCGLAVSVGDLDNKTYTVREYLSDLYSRRTRLSKAEVGWVNNLLFRFATRIQSEWDVKLH